jgi:ankyrin repeat protein
MNESETKRSGKEIARATLNTQLPISDAAIKMSSGPDQPDAAASVKGRSDGGFGTFAGQPSLVQSSQGFLTDRTSSEISFDGSSRKTMYMSRRQTLQLQQEQVVKANQEAAMRERVLQGLVVRDVFISAALGELDERKIGGVVIPQIALAVYSLLAAGNRLHDQQREIERIKGIYVTKGRNLTVAKEVLSDRQSSFNELQAERADVEGALIRMKKLARFTLEKAKKYREKLRVWRLMNQVTASGHTAISWAATRGNFEAMDAMLLHGASVGFTASLVNLCATYLQHSYRLYKLLFKQQKKAQLSEIDPSAALQLELDSKASSGLTVIEQIAQLKEKRGRVLHKLIYQKRKIRLPMPEAAYAGKYEIIRRIYDRKMYHDYFANSWCSASSAPPYVRKAAMEAENKRLDTYNSNASKVHMWDLLLQGEMDVGAGRYDGDVGWILKGDPRDFHGEGRVDLQAVMALVEEKKERKRAERRRVRALSTEKRARHVGEEGLFEAIKLIDFKKVMWLVQAGSSSIDHECPDGRTALIAAAEENIVLPTHEYILNDDGAPCLLVEYLLDREMYRPAVNLESHMHGWTALIRAAMLSRRHVLQALLDRGANVNHINRHGKTALHYAAKTGDIDCTRILMERGINPDICDSDGHTAFEIAEDMGFLNIMMKISQYRAGFMGEVRVTRGMVDDTIKCPLGCGADVSPHETRFHMLECPYRVVECPQGCGVRLLQHREVEEHKITTCGRRVIICPDCKESYVLSDDEHHRNYVCRTRLLQCANECGQAVKWCDIEKHQVICTMRPTECPQKCGLTMPFVETYEHCRSDCKRRRINCPQQCLAWIMWMNLEHHMRDTCPCRPVPCPFCNITVPLRTCKEHEEVCDLRAELCKAKCGELVPLKEMKQHMRDSCANRYVDCDLLCGLKVRLSDMPAHVTKDCVNRLVPCPLGCQVDEHAPLIHLKVNQYQSKEIKFHVMHDCPLRDVVCPICAHPVKANVIEQHKMEACPLRRLHCTNPGCLKDEVAKDFERHIRFECRFRLQPCIQGCGELVQFIRMGKHIISSCLMRHEVCPLQCGMTLRYNQMVSHLDNECSRRFNKSVHRARQTYLQGLAYDRSLDDDSSSIHSGTPSAHEGLSLLTTLLTNNALGESLTPSSMSRSNLRSASAAVSPIKSRTSVASTTANESASDRIEAFSRGNSRMSLLSAKSTNSLNIRDESGICMPNNSRPEGRATTVVERKTLSPDKLNAQSQMRQPSKEAEKRINKSAASTSTFNSR